MGYSAVHDLFIDERELRVSSNGTGRPILMLHDLGSSAAAFEHLTSPLVEAGRELVAVDLPGCGHSDPIPGSALADTVLHLVKMLPHLGSEPIDLLGHGFGGYLAAGIAAARPGSVSRLVLCEPTTPPRSGAPASSRMPPGMAVSGALTTLRRGRIRQNLLGFTRARSVLEQLAKPDPDWWTSLGGITAPTLVLSSGEAKVGERAVLDLLASAIPGAIRDEVPGPRKSHASAPTAFVDRIVKFFTI